MTVKEAKKAVLNLKRQIRPLAEETAKDLAPQFAETQRKQLREGTSAKGGKLRKYRSAEYAAMKARMNSLAGFGNPDLLGVTGRFHAGIQMNIRGGVLRLYSADEKAPFLLRKYGEENIFGLAPNTLDSFSKEVFKPAYKLKIDSLIRRC